MDPVQVALVFLIVTLIMVTIAISVLIIFLAIALKKFLDRINNVLDQGGDVAKGLGAMGKGTAGTLLGMFTRTLAQRAGKRIRR